MRWTIEQLHEAWRRSGEVGHGHGGMGRAMAYAVEIVAARGETMTAEQLNECMRSLRGSTDAERMYEHIAAQGARIAVLEADVSRWQETVETVRSERDTERDLRMAIRHRSLEAGNLERLIAEHGFPAAMRWVVDGKPSEPVQATCGHDLCKGTCTKYGPSEAEHTEYDLGDGPFTVTRYPCSPTCTHDDAATPGHPERVKERSEAFKASCQHEAPTFTPSGCGQCTAEQGRIVPLYSENYGGASPFHPSTEEDWDLSLVEEALAEKPDSAVSNGALYWRRRFLKVTDRLGWLDPETAKARRDEALDALRAAIRDAVLQELCASGAGVYGRERIGRVIDEVDPHPRRDACDEGAEAMRSACIAEARAFWEEEGVSQVLILRMIGRLEGATP